MTDGTPAGTELLGDLCLGTCDSEPRPVAALDGALLFTTRFGGDELWRSDGTQSGTVRLTTAGGEALTHTGFFLTSGGRLFFNGCTEADGCEPFVSDGTAAGTRMLRDFSPGPSDTSVSFHRAGGKVFVIASHNSSTEIWTFGLDGQGGTLVHTPSDDVRLAGAAGNRLFFVVSFHLEGDELWTSDGTAAGTRQLTSFANPFPFRSTRAFHSSGDRVYFVADDVVHGDEIWVSDGTVAGTRRITDFGFHRPFEEFEFLESPMPMALLGNQLLFFAHDGLSHLKLWKTDGSPETTAPVSDVRVSLGSALQALGGRALFTAEDASFSRELWSSDGTPGGTFAVCGAGCEPDGGAATVTGGAAYFEARGFLWRTDGTRAGTRRVTDVPLLSSGVRPDVGSLRGEALFAAAGDELWASDGRPGGTRLVADLVSSNTSSWPDQLTPLGDGVLFTACPDFNRTVWFSRGTAESTVEVLAAGDGSCPSQFGDAAAAAGGNLFFLRRGDFFDTQLRKTDGTPGGTVPLTAFTDHNVTLSELEPFGASLAFVVGDRSLWLSDGTPGGTREVFSLPEGVVNLQHLTALGHELYFTSHDPGAGTQVWVSDGTGAGTRKIADLPFFNPEFTRVGAAVFFIARGPDGDDVVWRTDGSPGSIQAVAGAVYTEPHHPVAFGGRLYFFARTAAQRDGLWRVEASGAGPVLVREIPGPFEDRSRLPGLERPVVFGGRLFFAADDGEDGRELWASDGTTAGTALFRDLLPGRLGSQPQELTVAGDRLFFFAGDAVHGRELWTSDGTAAGTRMVQDVAPGARSSTPRLLTLASGRLYWSADDSLHGHELWTLPLAGPGCQPTTRRLCPGNGRFAVEAEWEDFQGNRGTGNAVALTADTGYFWFFNQANVEVILKVLDGRGLNDHFWVFYGALSSVEYHLTVTDATTGLTRRYFNPSGQLASVADTEGFGPRGAFGSVFTAAAADAAAEANAPALVSARTEPAAATGVCVPGPTRLCLNGGRFAVEVAWEDFAGNQGTGQAVPLTSDTGYFWFFNPANVEVVLKVLDGRALNDHFWVFYGALSSVEYELTVTDVETGAVREYRNPSGRLASSADTGAF